MDYITKETAKQVWLNYENIEQSEKAIKIIEENIAKNGENFKLEDGINERFHLEVKNEEVGSYSIIGVNPALALKCAKKIRKSCFKNIKGLRLLCLIDLNMPKNVSDGFITKDLARDIHNTYYEIDEAIKFKNKLEAKIKDKKPLELRLRDGYFGSSVAIAIPVSAWTEVEDIQPDITIEILENNILNKKKRLQQLNEEALIELTK